jgi:hypothetical protein
LDAVVWDDLCRLLTEPAVLADALRRARQGWLSGDERAARLRDARRRQVHTQRQIQRLVDAYAAEALTLEELRVRRRALEQRLAELRREEQRAAAEAVREEQVRDLASRIETFRAARAAGLARATFDQRRALVELPVDRVVVDAPDVEIRYVIPLTGLARRNGALRPRHRDLQSPDRLVGRRPAGAGRRTDAVAAARRPSTSAMGRCYAEPREASVRPFNAGTSLRCSVTSLGPSPTGPRLHERRATTTRGIPAPDFGRPHRDSGQHGGLHRTRRRSPLCGIAR